MPAPSASLGFLEAPLIWPRRKQRAAGVFQSELLCGKVTNPALPQLRAATCRGPPPCTRACASGLRMPAVQPRTKGAGPRAVPLPAPFGSGVGLGQPPARWERNGCVQLDARQGESAERLQRRASSERWRAASERAGDAAPASPLALKLASRGEWVGRTVRRPLRRGRALVEEPVLTCASVCQFMAGGGGRKREIAKQICSWVSFAGGRGIFVMNNTWGGGVRWLLLEAAPSWSWKQAFGSRRALPRATDARKEL